MIAFCGDSINASAALSGGSYLTPTEARQVFGESLSVTFFDGSDYVDTTASYFGKYAIQSVFSENIYDSVYVGAEALVYQVNISATTNTNVSYVTVRARPRYSIIGTTQLHTWIGCVSNATISTVYQSPAWDWTIGHFENSDLAEANSGTHAYLRLGGSVYSFVPVDYTSQSEFSTYCTDATFFGNATTGGLFIAIGIPYIDSSSTAESGTAVSGGSGGSGGSSGTSVNVNVNVDMDETNGLLEGIQNTLSGIVNGIKNLFIPSAESLDIFKSNMEDLLEAHLGGLYEAVEILESIWTQFQSTQAKQSIVIPAVDIPLAGVNLPLGGWTVPLKVQGMPSIFYEGLAWIIDFLAVAAFINMCRNKLEIFLNPDSEVVQNDS